MFAYDQIFVEGSQQTSIFPVPADVRNYHLPNKSKSKAIPLQTWTDLEGSKKFWLRDIKTIGT